MTKSPTPGRRVVVAMSGGVDSSVVAALLHHNGDDVVGVAMRLYAQAEAAGKSCCSPDDLLDARAVANACGFPFYVANYQDEFRRRVVDYFVDEYGRGRTPSPCVLCNDHLKFDTLLDRLDALEGDALATGHYARLAPDPATGRRMLLRGADASKDQSYFLAGLRRGVLDRVEFPLGGMLKRDVRMLAAALGVPTAQKAESQDICFVGSGHYADLVRERLGEARIVRGKLRRVGDGAVLGDHDGIHQFTPGQRRGIGVAAGEPMYVQRVDASTGDVWLGTATSARASTVRVERINWIRFGDDDPPPATLRAEVQLRYRHRPAQADVAVDTDGAGATVSLAAPELGVAPGQAAVFYRGDEVLGGGWIEEVTH